MKTVIRWIIQPIFATIVGKTAMAILADHGFHPDAYIARLLSSPPEIAGWFGWLVALVIAGALWAITDYLFYQRFSPEIVGKTGFVILAEDDAHDVFEYVSTKSRWAWKNYRHLNFQEFVRDFTLREIERAAREGGLRASGRYPNQFDIVHPPRTYWEFARIDPDSITQRGKVRTVITHHSEPSGAKSLFSLRFTAIDKDRIWPKAYLVEKLISLIYVAIKKVKYWISGRTEKLLWDSKQLIERIKSSYIVKDRTSGQTIVDWPDFDELDKLDKFRLFEAACYCCDLREAQLPMPEIAQRLYDQWVGEWMAGDKTRLGVLMSTREAVSSAFEMVEKRSNTVINPEIVVTREALRQWCDQRELRPRFLYKYRRGEP